MNLITFNLYFFVKINVRSLTITYLDYNLKLSASTDPERGRALGKDHEIGVCSKRASGVHVAIKTDAASVKP